MKMIPPKGHNLRADCAWVLFTILERGVSARDCLPVVVQKYEQARDRNWLNEATMGVLRQLPLLQSWLRPLLSKPLKGNKKVVEHLLLVGFYQLEFMRTSSHAAINETVSACRQLNANALRGLVNGILRTFQRTDRPKTNGGALEAGLPSWLYKNIQSYYPNDATSIVHSMNSKPPLWLRVNTQYIDTQSYQQKLQNAQVDFVTSPHHPEAIIIDKGDITKLPNFDEGAFSVQDGAAQLAAHLLAPKPGERVLDCCAAPGGKTSHLYALAPDSHISAVEVDQERLLKIEQNLARLGAKANVIQGDACQPEQWWNGVKFDRILLDAPCSATGIIRRHPDIRWLRKASDIPPLVALQATLLDKIWPLLNDGGTLLYATCSILPEENTQQIKAFLTRTPSAHLDNIERQILPGEEQMDGFYYARLVKSKVNNKI